MCPRPCYTLSSGKVAGNKQAFSELRDSQEREEGPERDSLIRWQTQDNRRCLQMKGTPIKCPFGLPRTVSSFQLRGFAPELLKAPSSLPTEQHSSSKQWCYLPLFTFIQGERSLSRRQNIEFSLNTLEDVKFQKCWQEFNHRIPSEGCIIKIKGLYDPKGSLINWVALLNPSFNF